jgi:hypothetical protein
MHDEAAPLAPTRPGVPSAPARPDYPQRPVLNNRTHRAFAYRRVGNKWGWLRWSGLGYIGSTRSPEDIAAKFKGRPVDADLVRQILAFATAHLFVEMRPETGGTGYFCMLPKEMKPPCKVNEPDDPREDDPEGDDETSPTG